MMPVKVMYQDNVLDEVDPSVLQELISSRKIKKFLRSDGWVSIESAPLRGHGGFYNGPERRAAVVPVIASKCESLRGHNKETTAFDDEIIRSHKLESLMLLAGGIAHNFNNILTSILGNIALARITSPDKIMDRLAEAEKAALLAKELSQELLNFAKGVDPIKKTVSSADMIWDSVALFCSGLKSVCDVSITDDVWPINADPGQIHQVLHNLIINADHAMPDGGKICIRCENTCISADDAQPLRKGNYVKIAVHDQGIGIPEENLQKVFDPYFTTKDNGNGLGLASTYAIIKNHDGFITVESILGLGSRFTVYLPASI